MLSTPVKEWRGQVQAKYGAAPGPLVVSATVDDYGAASFVDLAPDDYVGYSSVYPTRRLFFKVPAS